MKKEAYEKKLIGKQRQHDLTVAYDKRFSQDMVWTALGRHTVLTTLQKCFEIKKKYEKKSVEVVSTHNTRCSCRDTTATN